MNIASILADPDYHELKDYIVDHTGLAYYVDKDEDLATRIARRLTSRTVTTCKAYLALLCGAAGKTEMDQLIGELTIGETYFFRQPEHFTMMRETVLPELLERNKATRRLRIWSAGCATGPEPYSIALMLQRDFRVRTAGWEISILGTDINLEFLARAQAAQYSAWALREMPEEIKESCFIEEGKQWLLRPEYRRMVAFRYHNLTTKQSPADDGQPFDLIICRNVIIYFSRERIVKVLEHFHEQLVPDGWLIVGHAEPNMELFRSFETICSPEATAYRKHSDGRLHSLPVIELHSPYESFVSPDSPNAPCWTIVTGPETPAAVSNSLEDARMLADRGKWEAATDITTGLIEKDALNAPAHFLLGLLRGHAGASEESCAAFRRAIYLDRGFALAHYHLGAALEATCELEAARKAFRNVLKLLEGRPDEEPVPCGEGVKTVELRELTRMHMELKTL